MYDSNLICLLCQREKIIWWDLSY